MAAVSSSLCNVYIARTSRPGGCNAFNIDRLGANDFIVESLTSICGEGHGYKMLAQSLTEAVCIRNEVEATWVFEHAGENWAIVVRS